MKYVLLVGLLLVIVGGLKAINAKETTSSEGISFYEGKWADILSRAEKENKLIFLDIYATWCGPCKMLKRKTFPDGALGNYFNSNFINVTFDGESGEGIELAERYKIKGYPTLLILDAKGNLVSGTAGYMPPATLLKFGQEAVNKKNK